MKNMKRYLWIPAMAPVMCGLFRLVCWADCLHAWQYSPEAAPPTSADHVRAAIVFWGSLLTPLLVGIGAAVVAFRRRCPAQWPIAEASITGVPVLVLVAGLINPSAPSCPSMQVSWGILLWAHLFVGGAIVLALRNVGATMRQRQWGKSSLSMLASCAGMLYLLWLYAFIIYVDT